MEKSAPSDHDLLAQWLGERREAAFHTLVDRYTALVHATARRTCGDESIATEASQLTFITLAGKAASLLSCASLGGWLHATSMMHAKNLLRKSQREDRKRHHLQLAMDTTPTDPTSQSVWKDMEPMLDEALAALPAKDREALLLRFYRSLSIREIATTLGIATAAAQKRVDRATERLRSHLSRRGCQAGGTLSAAMLTGLAADAQAALPASSVLASKALAASAATAGVGSFTALTTFLTATAMKTTSIVPPLVALLAAVTWIGSQRRSLASVENEGMRLRQQAADHSTASAVRGMGTRASSPQHLLPKDWKELVAQLDNPFINRQFRDRVDKMPAEELVQSLREVSAIDLLQGDRLTLEDILTRQLMKVDPKAMLVCFPEKIGDTGPLGRVLPTALLGWAKKEPADAAAWLDARIAEGRLESRKLDRSDFTRSYFEASVLLGVLPSDTLAAGARLKNLTESERAEAMRYAGSLGVMNSPEAFIALAREHLSDDAAKEAITTQAGKRSNYTDFSSMNEFLNAVAATPSEREHCVRIEAPGIALEIIMKRKITLDDIRAIRDWATSQSPALAGEATGDVLGVISIQHDQIPYTEILSLVRSYHEAGDGDSILISFLENTGTEDEANKASCRDLAEKITDEAKRTEILENLQ